jgi:hypothetical protein
MMTGSQTGELDPRAEETRCFTVGGQRTRVGRACIALPAQGRDYEELVSVLAAVVQELGGKPFFVRDGDRAILEADVVILFGKCSAFETSARLLSAHATQRPATVLWHVEPLPPGPIPAQAENAARRLVRCDLNELPHPLPALVRSVPGHSLLVNLVRQAYSAPLVRRCHWEDRTPDGFVHGREWYHAVTHALWFQQRYSSTWCDFVAASTMPRCRVLTEMGIPCEYAPLGYHPLWGTNQGADRDIDVVFLGRVKQTGRERLLGRIERRLAKAGVKLVVADHDCYDEDRIKLLNRARISLDLAKNTWEMPVLRLLVSMACGALVVSNCPLDPYPFREEHLVRVDSDSLAAAILEHLHNEPARRQITEAAHRYLTTELAWSPVVARLLQRALAQQRTCQGAAP